MFENTIRKEKKYHFKFYLNSKTLSTIEEVILVIDVLPSQHELEFAGSLDCFPLINSDDYDIL